MPRPHATPQHRELVRNRIRNAAADIYRKEGLAAISARSIATRAEVSIGALYAHFGDLASLMQSLWMGRVEQQNAVFRQIAAEHADPLERLSALLREYLDFGLRNIELYRNAFLFVRPEIHEKPVPEAFSSYDFPSLLTAAIRDAQSAGQVVKGSPEHLAQVLWAGVHGGLALPMNFDRVAFAPTPDVADAMVSMLLRGISESLSSAASPD